MNMRIKMVCVSGLVCLQATSHALANPKTHEEAKRFVADYLSLINTHNINVVGLYSESATINVTVTTLDRATTKREIGGHTWKQLLRDAWYNGKPSIEPAELHDVMIQETGDGRLSITAHRYAVPRCYWDNSYQMEIAETATGGFQVVNETLFIDHQNQCQHTAPSTIRQSIEISQP